LPLYRLFTSWQEAPSPLPLMQPPTSFTMLSHPAQRPPSPIHSFVYRFRCRLLKSACARGAKAHTEESERKRERKRESPGRPRSRQASQERLAACSPPLLLLSSHTPLNPTLSIPQISHRPNSTLSVRPSVRHSRSSAPHTSHLTPPPPISPRPQPRQIAAFAATQPPPSRRRHRGATAADAAPCSLPPAALHRRRGPSCGQGRGRRRARRRP
jgi:hypothetical protein